MSLEIHPVTPERWRDMVELFERRGVRDGRRNSPAYGCWCTYWRDRSLQHGEPKKRAMGKLVRGGREPGLLASESGVPIGWVAIAPRDEYTGAARALLGAAVGHAFAHGASSVEAYPHAVDPRDSMGQTELYRRAGFRHVRDANKRAIVRLERPPQ